MMNSKSMSTLELNDSHSGSNLMMPTMYRLRIVSLMYLTHTWLQWNIS
jgi:hypothetical protein